MEWRHVRIRERSIAAGGTYDYVKSKPVPPGKTWRLHDIVYGNETGARSTFRLYIEGHGYNHYLSELQGPGADELITHPGTVHITEGERLVVRQATCTANDNLALYALGEEIDSLVLQEEV